MGDERSRGEAGGAVVVGRERDGYEKERLVMKTVLLLGWLMLAAGPRVGAAWVDDWRGSNRVWRGVHVMSHGGATVRELEGRLPALAAGGLNVLILEVNYGFEYESHPELRGDGAVLTKAEAARFAKACRERGIRLVPQFSCLGHQSWAKSTFPLLTRYPELDETPGQFPNNEKIYCRSWCPQHPRVPEIILPMLDELLNAFDADAMHVGMDEVFLIASEHCARCRGGNAAELFARAVSDLHAHLVGRRQVEMLMWGDRLLDAASTGLGEWEAAKNGTHGAVDRIPKDIVICDWHYEPLSRYPGKPSDYNSVPFLLGKGFRVWPSGWKNAAVVEAFVDSAAKHRTDRLMGYLATTWGAVKPAELAEWEPLRVGFSRVTEWDRR